jgi:hypothetical protein
MQQVNSVGGRERIGTVQAADRGPHRDSAGADDQLVVAEHSSPLWRR